jgi:hypothetical protein
MKRNKKRDPVSGIIILLLVLANAITIVEAYTGNDKWFWALVVTVPLLLLTIITLRQRGKI